MIYGYCRISTKKQSMERQIKNIREYNTKVKIIEEIYTGTKIEGRNEWNKLYKKVKKGDTIIFDSVSRMSRNKEEGVKDYMELYNRGVELEFLKEPHINTSVYREVLNGGIELTGTDVDEILLGVNKYMIRLAEKQIIIAFEQAEKEVKDLQKRTKEALQIKKDNKEKLGLPKGTKLVTKKSIKAKEIIKKHAKNFGGTLNNTEVIKLAGINRSSFYKYQKELIEELNNQD